VHAEPKLEPPEYQAIVDLLFEWAGIRLQNKQQLVLGRLKPRLRELGLASFREYVRRVRDGGRGGPEAQSFINQLTTNKTAFFREPHHFDYLRKYLTQVVAPRAIARGDRRIRVWSAASSTGEEPYTLAMVLADALPTSAGWDLRVRASDIDTACLQTAQRAEYDQERAEDVPVQFRQRMFAPAGAGKLRIAPEIARLVSFEQLNLVRDKSFGNERFDAIFCRNVIIYFDLETQQRVIERLSQRLAPGARLYLGHSETLVNTQLQRVAHELGVYQVAQGRHSSNAPTPSVRRPQPQLPPSRQASRIQTAPQARVGRHHGQQAVVELLRSLDRGERLPQQRVVLGEWFASAKPHMISTLLGSCVSACLYDEQAQVGGMNHFMLPNSEGASSAPANFGIHAMELLINGLMSRGAARARIKAKVFGAGAVTQQLPSTVGDANASFVLSFLQREAIPVVAQRLGGSRPREVFFRSDTGEAIVRAMSPQKAKFVEQRELGAFAKKLPTVEPFNADEALF